MSWLNFCLIYSFSTVYFSFSSSKRSCLIEFEMVETNFLPSARREDVVALSPTQGDLFASPANGITSAFLHSSQLSGVEAISASGVNLTGLTLYAPLRLMTKFQFEDGWVVELQRSGLIVTIRRVMTLVDTALRNIPPKVHF